MRLKWCSGWMDICYPFRENFEAYSKPEGVWEGFEEAIEEAKEFERTGQFIMVPVGRANVEEGASDDDLPARRKKRAPAKRRRPAQSSSEDENFGASSDEEGGSKPGKRVVRKAKTTREARPPKRVSRPIRASKEQKLFAREIFGIIKQIEKAIEEKNLDAALALLKKFDPKTVTKRMNKEGLTVDAPGPYAMIESQVVHISRLGKFVHGLSKVHENDILGPYSQTLYRHLRSNALRELALPDEIAAYIANQDRSSSKKPSSSSPPDSAPSSSSNPPSSSMDITNPSSDPSSIPQNLTDPSTKPTNASEMDIAPSTSSGDLSAPNPIKNPVKLPAEPLDAMNIEELAKLGGENQNSIFEPSSQTNEPSHLLEAETVPLIGMEVVTEAETGPLNGHEQHSKSSTIESAMQVDS